MTGAAASSSTPGLNVVGEAGTGTQAVPLVRDVHPDVVVMDIRMPGLDGIEATRMITAGPGTARVVVLTTFDDDDCVYASLRAGASGFLVKDMALEDILTVIRVATAKAHVARLLVKLGARDRVQLVIAAYDAGLVGRVHHAVADGEKIRVSALFKRRGAQVHGG